MGRGRRVLLLGLAILWLADGLLQLQPAMFTPAMLAGLWAPVAQGNPGWLADLVHWSIALARPWLPVFNSLIAATQLVIGVLLLSGRSRLVRAGLWASLGFGLLVWVCGEGMGGLLAGGANLLAGAPGSALLYSLGSAALLLPESAWRRLRRGYGLDPLQAATAVLLLAGAVWQCAAPNWTGFGLSAPAANNFMLPQPGLLRSALGAASGVAMAAPVLTNALLVGALLASALGVTFAPQSTAVAAGTLLLLAVLWVCGQDAGLLFSGGATDPNTMPLLALFVLALWRARSAPAAAGPQGLPADGAQAPG